MDNPIFAVIDLGSYETVGMIGTKVDNQIKPLAFAKESSSSAVRHGFVSNINNAATVFEKILGKLNKDQSIGENNTISKVYVGVGAQSIASNEVVVERKFEEDTEITQDLLVDMKNEASLFSDSGKENLMVTTPTYLVNDVQEKNPKGMPCTSLKAFYQVITARESVRRNITKALNRINVELADLIVSPIALAEITLSDSSKILGCCQIDLGAGKTSVCIYNNGTPVALYVLPMGGHNVTTDLTALRFIERDAEQLKIEKGSVMVETDRNKTFKVTDVDKTTDRTINMFDFTKITSARMKEIFVNIINIIRCSNMDRILNAGIQITGGGAKIGKFKEFLLNKLEVVSDVTLKRDLVQWDRPEVMDPKYFTALGLLRMAKDNCIALSKSLDTLFDDEVEEPKTETGVDRNSESALWTEDEPLPSHEEYESNIIIEDNPDPYLDSEDEEEESKNDSGNAKKKGGREKNGKTGIGSKISRAISKLYNSLVVEDDDDNDKK